MAIPQQINSKLLTCSNGVIEYARTVNIGENRLTVTFATQGKLLPTGIYPRRLLSYLCHYITTTRAKNPTIKIPKNKSNFLKDILKIGYVCSKNDTRTINNQLQAFVECQLSVNYSNPNDKARQQQEQIKFFTGDCNWLYDDSLEWQSEITLSNELFQLIKSSAVPISEHAVNTFTNSRALDVFNYFMYQNYNLNLKKMDHYFTIEELYNLFGAGISSINEFRRVFKRVIADIKKISSLEIVLLGKHGYKLLSNKESLLRIHSRRKTNEIKDPRLAINEDFKQKLEKDYTAIDIEAASIYVLKRIERGGKPIENPHAYMRDVLKNPSWYRNERTLLVQNIHKMQFNDYTQLSDSQRKITAQDLSTRLDRTAMLGIPVELRDYYRQIKHPGQDIIKNTPNWKYLCYLYWSLMTNRCVEYSTCSVEYMFIQLFKQLS